jgi:hypothetical protein
MFLNIFDSFSIYVTEGSIKTLFKYDGHFWGCKQKTTLSSTKVVSDVKILNQLSTAGISKYLLEL